jgi:hypothetical protein
MLLRLKVCVFNALIYRRSFGFCSILDHGPPVSKSSASIGFGKRHDSYSWGSLAINLGALCLIQLLTIVTSLIIYQSFFLGFDRNIYKG